MKKIIIGVDGGGTHTTLVASDEEGNIITWHCCESLNYNTIGMTKARERLFTAIQEIMTKAEAESCCLSIGLSALDREATEKEKLLFLDGQYPDNSVYMNSDVYMGLLGATLGQPGIMLVSGTGCMGMGLDRNGETCVAGGYGYRINQDEGSSYYAAAQAITRILHREDQLPDAGKTILTGKLLERFHLQNPREILSAIYDRQLTVKDIALFARDVVQCTDAGDRVAADILEELEKTWLNYIKALMRVIDMESCTIGVYGGMFEKNPSVFTGFKQRILDTFPYANVTIPSIPPAVGAILCWFHNKKLLERTILYNIQNFRQPDFL